MLEWCLNLNSGYKIPSRHMPEAWIAYYGANGAARAPATGSQTCHLIERTNVCGVGRVRSAPEGQFGSAEASGDG